MEVYLENSKSKTGKHAIRTLIFEVKNNELVEFKNFQVKNKLPPTYRVGEKDVIVVPDKGIFIHLVFIKNIKNKVRGKVKVYKDGHIVSEMNYRKLKLKLVNGDQSYIEQVKALFEKLKIPVKGVNTKLK
ncbi:hypothetical protein [Stygiolobus caldivivus]|uniref:Uncharacterized protein n=1 Tax=Stygiolobus caldivivus TaxID=2824673 RepID=A0A8D5U943_9CREN|nr:hypothetical protein [Stygiolobus caldivivus]BCU71212.1 hypothetical protein KN1_25090 [Stygiolobus caldivivus]